eukprot:3537315-Karenia_brevis.AAC.1
MSVPGYLPQQSDTPFLQKLNNSRKCPNTGIRMTKPARRSTPEGNKHHDPERHHLSIFNNPSSCTTKHMHAPRNAK